MFRTHPLQRVEIANVVAKQFVLGRPNMGGNFAVVLPKITRVDNVVCIGAKDKVRIQEHLHAMDLHTCPFLVSDVFQDNAVQCLHQASNGHFPGGA